MTELKLSDLTLQRCQACGLAGLDGLDVDHRAGASTDFACAVCGHFACQCGAAGG